jgi:hypothetical protein
MAQKRRRPLGSSNTGPEQPPASKVEDLATRMSELQQLREQVKKAETGLIKMKGSDPAITREACRK